MHPGVEPALRRWPRLLALVLVLGACGVVMHQAREGQRPAWSLSPQLGGDLGVADTGPRAFSHPSPNLPLEQRAAFEVGDSFFNRNWVQAPASATARDGLGPLFNARSCSGCHVRDGRGQPMDGERVSDSILFRLSIAGRDERTGGPVGDPTYGGQLNHRSVLERGEGRVVITLETVSGSYADGTPYELQRPRYELTGLGFGPMADDLRISPRVTPQVIGLGLLEHVAAADILARADPDDADGDGISGRPNRVWDIERGERVLGRFGWKANQPSLRQQTAGAFNGDLSITSSLFPQEAHLPVQGAQGLDDLPHGGEPELEDRALERVTFYLQHLAVPDQRDGEDPAVQRGWRHFQDIGCADCHTPTLTTPSEGVPATLAGQTFHPFTDLLLHDMGEDLADHREDYEADGREWRTPPLWGIGLIPTVNGHSRYLHDGRARNLAEAILWHGGEGATSRDAFKALDADAREALLAFLRSL